MKKNISISVVIPCKNDKLVINCVKSIKHIDEILIIFNGATKDFEKYVMKELAFIDNLRYVSLKLPNLAWALEKGTREARSDYVLYMDSDCFFDKKAIKAFKETAIKHDKSSVFKGEVIFTVGDTIIERMISKSRTHHTTELLTAYKPPLMIPKSIVRFIGGYAFDHRLKWREDSDLDYRIRRAGIEIVAVKDGLIYHKKITLKTDLRSTYRYGIGLALSKTMNIPITEVPRSVLSTLKSQGILPAIYMLLRNRVYDAGYYITQFKLITGRITNDSSPNKVM